jgi:class 3 adenylate cyclase
MAQDDERSGWMALVFTDVESSTRLWQLDEEAFSWALAEHDALVRQCLLNHDGTEVKHTGDGFFLSFPIPHDAAQFAIELLNRMKEHEWPVSLGELKARVGIHYGAVRHYGDDVRGAAVSLTSRICEAGHGMQVIVSTEVVEALAEHPELSSRVRYLGESQLSGIQTRTDLFELRVFADAPVNHAASLAEAEAVEAPPPAASDDDLWHEARAALRRGEPKTAIEQLLELGERNPADPKVLGTLGVALASAKQFERAENCLRRSLELSPRQAGVWYNLARLYGKMGRRDDLKQALRQALAIDPDHPKAQAAARKYGLTN